MTCQGAGKSHDVCFSLLSSLAEIDDDVLSQPRLSNNEGFVTREQRLQNWVFFSRSRR